jgi:hypothetical protein
MVVLQRIGIGIPTFYIGKLTYVEYANLVELTRPFLCQCLHEQVS